MNERGMRAATGPMMMSIHRGEDTMPQDGRPSLLIETQATGGILHQSLELAEALVEKVAGPCPPRAENEKRISGGILDDALANRLAAERLYKQLEELSRLLG